MITKFQCDQCKYETGQKISLRRHQLAMHVGKILHCMHCEREYKWEADLRRHITKTHTDQIFNCNQCGKVYTEQRTLNKHVKAIHEMITKKCTFSNCDFVVRFGDNFTMKLHTRSVHEGQEPILYHCKICSYMSTRHSDLQRHNNAKHLKLSQFQCYFCDYKAKRRDLLKQHIHKKHKQTFQKEA